jgi:hypothetical protein
MKRREFMAGLVGAATTLPMQARSQTAAAKVFRVGLLSPGALIVDNPESGAAFLQALSSRPGITLRSISRPPRPSG